MKRSVVFFLALICFTISFPLAAQDICPGNLPPRLIVDEKGQVTPGDANRVREKPSLDAELVGSIPGEGVFDVLDGPICAEGFTWWQVSYLFLTGWTVEGNATDYWLQPYELPEPIVAGYFAEENDIVTATAAGVQFTFQPRLSRTAVYEQIPASTLLDRIFPAHDLFTLVNFPGQESDSDIPDIVLRMEIYPLQDLLTENRDNERLLKQIDVLRQLLDEQPEQITDEIPTLTFGLTAKQLIRSQIRYLDFSDGTAIAFVTDYAQDLLPIFGDKLHYLVLGITADDQYLIFMNASVQATTALEEVTSAEYDIDSAQNIITFYFGDNGVTVDEIRDLDYRDYLIQVETTLNNAPTDAFEPDLLLLDELVQSLQVSLD